MSWGLPRISEDNPKISEVDPKTSKDFRRWPKDFWWFPMITWGLHHTNFALYVIVKIMCVFRIWKLPSSLCNLGNFCKFLKTRMILILNFTRPNMITYSILTVGSSWEGQWPLNSTFRGPEAGCQPAVFLCWYSIWARHIYLPWSPVFRCIHVNGSQ